MFSVRSQYEFEICILDNLYLSDTKRIKLHKTELWLNEVWLDSWIKLSIFLFPLGSKQILWSHCRPFGWSLQMSGRDVVSSVPLLPLGPSSPPMGLLQQEFLPVLQPSIQTADRYQVEKHLLIVCCLSHVFPPMVFSSLSLGALFHALFICF